MRNPQDFHSHPIPTGILSQLKPFNASIFDDVFGYLDERYQSLLTQYDLMKIHVVIDVEHAFKTGSPLIGGAMKAWPYGPVVNNAYDRLRSKKEDPTVPFSAIGQLGHAIYYRATARVDAEDFSAFQLSLFDRAWQLVRSMPFSKSQRYFHGEDNDNAIGFAWKQAKLRNPTSKQVAMNWWDIIAGGETLQGFDLSHIRALIQL